MGCKRPLTVLEPHLRARQQEMRSAGVVVIGTVQGDIHEIGKSLVGTMFSANGFQVYDLGVDVPVETFVGEGEGDRGEPGRPFSAADHHDGRSERSCGCFVYGRFARAGEGAGGRCAGDPELGSEVGPTATRKTPLARWRWRRSWLLTEGILIHGRKVLPPPCLPPVAK